LAGIAASAIPQRDNADRWLKTNTIFGAILAWNAGDGFGGHQF
jgi:hypothetical protein